MKKDGEGRIFRKINLFIKERLTNLRTTPSELFFRENKFKTGLINLAELRIEAELNKNQFYKFEWAENIFKKEEEICFKYLCNRPLHNSAVYSNLNGLCLPIVKKIDNTLSCGNVVVVKRNLSAPIDIYTLGHEDGHFLGFMDLKHLVYREYNVPENIREKIRDTEDFAMFCGNIAMANAGYKLNKIRTETPDPLLKEKDSNARERVIEVIPEQFYASLFKKYERVKFL